jgi:hypothetical protein
LHSASGTACTFCYNKHRMKAPEGLHQAPSWI